MKEKMGKISEIIALLKEMTLAELDELIFLLRRWIKEERIRFNRRILLFCPLAHQQFSLLHQLSFPSILPASY